MQAVYRGFQVRKHYRKICWSVGVLEKALLRWRMKRRGFRGLRVCPVEAVEDQKHESDVEEDFFKASRQQAEERVERSVVRVQAMFRSKKAQQEYRNMKLAYDQARVGFFLWGLFKTNEYNDHLTKLTFCFVQLQYEGLVSPDTDMG